MSRDWTPAELQAASAAMKSAGHMGYEEFCAELPKAKLVKVTLADGDVITTQIYGTDKVIRDYYRIGSMLNVGVTNDRFVAVAAVDIVDGG